MIGIIGLELAGVKLSKTPIILLMYKMWQQKKTLDIYLVVSILYHLSLIQVQV